MAEIVFLTKAQISERRATLLKQAGMSLEVLESRAETYQLSPEQTLLLSELHDLEFLARA